MKKTRRRSQGSLDALSSKALPFVVAGSLLVLFPILRGALRPLGWILLILGIFAFTLPRVVKALKAKVLELEKLEQAKDRRAEPFSGKPLQSVDIGRLDPNWGRKPDIPKQAAVTDVPSRQESWSPSVFKDIEWRRFEAVCETLFAQAGFTTKAQSHGPDGGVDIWLYSRNAEGAVAVVQCKHWSNKPVGVREMREFFGVMTSNKLKRGTFATSSTYTPDAHQFAKDNGINALDGAALINQISSRTAEQQTSLLAVAYEGEYWRPTVVV